MGCNIHRLCSYNVNQLYLNGKKTQNLVFFTALMEKTQNLAFFTASPACLPAVRKDWWKLNLCTSCEIPAFRTVGFWALWGETGFNLLPTRSLLLRQSDLSGGPEIVPGTSFSAERCSTRWLWVAEISSCCHSMLLGFSGRQVALSKTSVLLIVRCTSSRCEDPKPLLYFQMLPRWCIPIWSNFHDKLCVTDLPGSPAVQLCASWTPAACGGTWYRIRLVIVPFLKRRVPQSSPAALENHLHPSCEKR